MFDLCPPALLYIGFTIIQIIIDMFQQSFNTAILKFFIMIIFAILLNLLCKVNLGIISWFIVFIPFIFMTVITTTLLFVFEQTPGDNNNNNKNNNNKNNNNKNNNNKNKNKESKDKGNNKNK